MAEDAKNEYAQKLVKCNEQQKNHHTQLIPGKFTWIWIHQAVVNSSIDQANAAI